MKKLLIGLLMLSSTVSISQVKFGDNVNVTFFNGPQNLTSPTMIIDYLNDNTAIALSMGMIKKDATLNVIDIAKNTSDAIPLKFSSKREYAGLSIIENKILAYSTFLDKKTNSKTLYYENVLLDKGSLQGNATELLTVEAAKTTMMNPDYFSIKESLDKSKNLVIYPMSPKAIEFGVFDKNFNKIYDVHHEFAYKEGLFNIEFFNTDNNGRVYVLAKIFNENAKVQANGESNYSYSIFMFSEKGDFERELKVGKTGLFYHDMRTVLDHNQDLIIFGLYSDKIGDQNAIKNYLTTGETSGKNTELTSGKYLLKFDAKSKTIIKEDHQLFEESYLRSYLGDKDYEKTLDKDGVAQLENLTLDILHVSPSNNVTAIVENIEQVKDKFNPEAQLYITTYKNFMVLGISPDGNFSYSKKIERSFTLDAEAIGGINTTILRNQDEVGLIYYDSSESAEYSLIKSTVDGTGNINTQLIASFNKKDLLKDNKPFPYGIQYGEYSNNQFALYGTSSGMSVGIWFVDIK